MSARHLYIHVPFCARRCAYCDFSIAVRRITPVAEYLGALEQEIDSRQVNAASLETVYFGGGTPSRLGPAGLSSALALIRDRFPIDDGAEITIEANPDDVTEEDAASWIAAGINRVSLGIQSFDDSVLQWMHRVHDAGTGARAFGILRDAGFENLSVDLIFALPETLRRSWESDLKRALDLAPDHISLYGLTIEPSTPLSRWTERGVVAPADEDRYAGEFLLADALASQAGFEHYEVSNFASPGKRSRHNAAYWSGVPYIGIGPSAHSFDGESRSWNVPAYADWVEKLRSGESIVADRETLTESNRAAERVYLGLRTRGGLEVTGVDRGSAVLWREKGWATLDGDRVRLTSEGWLRLDSLAAALTGT